MTAASLIFACFDGHPIIIYRFSLSIFRLVDDFSNSKHVTASFLLFDDQVFSLLIGHLWADAKTKYTFLSFQ